MLAYGGFSDLFVLTRRSRCGLLGPPGTSGLLRFEMFRDITWCFLFLAPWLRDDESSRSTKTILPKSLCNQKHLPKSHDAGSSRPMQNSTASSLKKGHSKTTSPQPTPKMQSKSLTTQQIANNKSSARGSIESTRHSTEQETQIAQPSNIN